MKETKPRNILVTLDENYIPYLNVMLFSLLHSNPDCFFHVYLLHTAIPPEATATTERILGEAGRLHRIQAESIGLQNAPTTARYPKEMYYRIFAAQYLPQSVDRVLYLDPDTIINGSIDQLYQMPMETYYFAAASHVRGLVQRINTLRLDMDEENLYINSGVMLMNLELLRKEQQISDVFAFIESHRNVLVLPDQDIISSLYGTRICALDSFRYNMTERLYLQHAPFERGLNLDWIRKNAVVIHYCGRNKPWKPNYYGQLNVFYLETVARMREELLGNLESGAHADSQTTE